MGLIELFLIAVSLSMDAFAVSVCKGLSVSKVNLKHALTAGLYFGGVHAADWLFFGNAVSFYD